MVQDPEDWEYHGYFHERTVLPLDFQDITVEGTDNGGEYDGLKACTSAIFNRARRLPVAEVCPGQHRGQGLELFRGETGAGAGGGQVKPDLTVSRVHRTIVDSAFGAVGVCQPGHILLS